MNDESVKMNSPAQKLSSLVAYTTNTWESPLATLRITGPSRQAGLKLIKGNEEGQIFPERVSSADLVLIQRDFPRHVEAYRQITARARAEGKPVVFDLDDLLLELPPDHPDRAIYYYNAALLPMIRAIVEADAVTASNARLCDYLRPFNPDVWLLPNYLDDQLWTLRTPKPPGAEHTPLVLGYMGGDSHLPDLQMITPALVNILKRYGEQVVVRLLGARPPTELLAQPNVEWTPSQTFVYADFAAQFGKQAYDIFIAPLRDNLFNHCKSPIKFLEYSALGVPGIYSPVDAYTSVITHGENGFLAATPDNWEEYLSLLIDDPELRYQIALKAQETVRQHWLLSQNAQTWMDVYAQITSRPKEDRPPSLQPPTSTFLRVSEQVQDLHQHYKTRHQALLAQLAEKNQALEALRGNQSTQGALKSQLADKDNAIQVLSARLDEIYGSNAWNLIQRLWRIRLALVPNGSRRERIFRLSIQGLRVLKNEGLLPFLRKSSQKLLPRSSPEVQPISDALNGDHQPVIEHTDQPASPIPLIETQSTQAVEKESEDRFPGIQFEGLRPEASVPGITRQPAKIDIIVLPVMEWASRVQRPQQIARQFARAGHRVFYLYTAFRVNLPGLIRPVEENIFEIQLPSAKNINIYTDAMDEADQVNFLEAFASLKQEAGIVEAVCLVDLPFWTPLAFRLREKYGWKIVYDCMDYHKGFSTNSEQMLQQEETLSRQSDMVLVTSHFLLQEKAGLNSNCVQVSNGADFDHFRFPPVEIPAEINSLKQPIIGYYGAIADWFDTDLIRDLALARTDWNFVLIGSTRYADLEPLEGLDNVHLLGEMPYARLPQYLHAFDVAIIPFKKQPLTEATNPVKLFEYLSAGKPVVVTDLNELRHYDAYVQLASSPEQWLQAIQTALNEGSLQLVQERMDFARQNTWERRFAKIERSLKDLFPKASIIILTYNNLDYTRLCLESIYSKTIYPNYEVIVVDNASSDGTQEFLQDFAESHPNVQIAFNETNEGFACGNNRGAALATGEFLIFLNNDTVVTGDWLSGLTRHLGDPAIGAVGPVTNFSGNESCIPVDYHVLSEMDDFARRYVTEHAHQAFEIRMLPFFCIALRRQVFEEIGPLEEAFGIGMFEDDDYALRLKAKGYKVICAENVFVHHWGKASFSKLDQAEYQHLFEENRRKFELKWGIAWEPHQYRQQ